MENSILISTKKILGIAADYTVFDEDIIMHINAAFGTLQQLGVPADGFEIVDDQAAWTTLSLPQHQLNMIKTYVFLKVRSLFDPPPTSFAIEAMNNQIKEYEWRISTNREWDLDPVDPRV